MSLFIFKIIADTFYKDEVLKLHFAFFESSCRANILHLQRQTFEVSAINKQIILILISLRSCFFVILFLKKMVAFNLRIPTFMPDLKKSFYLYGKFSSKSSAKKI